MKINKTIIPLLATFLLIGCNGENYDNISYPKIDDNEAIEVAKKISETQLSEEFTTPDKITIETNNKLVGSKFDYYAGKYAQESSTDMIDKIDMTNSVIYSYKHDKTKVNGESIESTIETYITYNADKEILYVLNNSNGNKSRTEESLNKDEAKIRFEIIKVGYEENILNTKHLKQFKTTVKIHQDYYNYFKDKADESYSYEFGSDNKTSSIQDRSEGRYKIDDLTHTLHGFLDFKNNDIIRDNKRLYTTSYTLQSISLPEDSKVYAKAETTKKTKYKYNVADIKVPNIDDYKFVSL